MLQNFDALLFECTCQGEMEEETSRIIQENFPDIWENTRQGESQEKLGTIDIFDLENNRILIRAWIQNKWENPLNFLNLKRCIYHIDETMRIKGLLKLAFCPLGKGRSNSNPEIIEAMLANILDGSHIQHFSVA